MSFAGPAWAAEPDRTPKGAASYDELVGEAVREYELGNWEEAIALFHQAHGNQPNARVHRGLGMAYFEARKYVQAVIHLKAALASEVRPLTASQYKQTEGLLARAERFVASFMLEGVPDNARVTVDGREAHFDEQGALTLDVGDHTVRVEADGYTSDRRQISVEAGRGGALRFELQSVGSEPAPVAQGSEPLVAVEAQPVPETTVRGRGPLPYVLMAVGGGLLAGAGVTGILARSAHSELDEQCPMGRCAPDVDLDATGDRGRTLMTASNVLLVSGITTLVAGGVVWLLTGNREQTAKPATGGMADLACTTHGCTAGWAGRF